MAIVDAATIDVPAETVQTCTTQAMHIWFGFFKMLDVAQFREWMGEANGFANVNKGLMNHIQRETIGEPYKLAAWPI